MPDRVGRKDPHYAEYFMAGALISFSLSFWFFTAFTHQLLSTKGSLKGLKNLHGILELFARNAPPMALCLLLAALSFVLFIVAMRRMEKGGWALFFNRQFGSSLLLLTITFCQLPLYFTSGTIDGSDPLCQINAMVEAAANYRMGEWPFYTFHFLNGISVGLQYPMLRTLLGGMFVFFSPFRPDLDYQLLSAATHVFLAIGFYRFLRLWKFSRIACVIPAVTLVGCHQMLVYYIAGAFPTMMACAFSVWTFAAFIRWFQSNDWHHAAASGFWLGFSILAHPVTALFTAYFLFLLALCLLVSGAFSRDYPKFIWQAGSAVLCCVLVGLPYLFSLVAFRSFDTYRPENVAGFQDETLRIGSNFKWLFKYMEPQPSSPQSGEYISIIIFIVAAIGLVRLGANLFSRSRFAPVPRYYGIACLLFFGVGAVLLYGRDTALVSAIPGVKLLKVYNRSFVYFALGAALLAARPIDELVRDKRYGWLLGLGLLLFIEQSPFWLRPSYFSLPENYRFRSTDYDQCDPKTSTFLVILPPIIGGAGNREDVLFHRLGFSGISPIDHEEQSVVGNESDQFHLRLVAVASVAEAQPLIDRLKWLRVTDVVWRYDAAPTVNLDSLGQMRNVTNGLNLHLDGPTMERNLRTLKLQVSSGDVQPDNKILLPIGFSSFLHCWRIDSPNNELPLLNRNGYTLVDQTLPVDTGLIIKSITPFPQSAVTWLSLLFDLGIGLYLLTHHTRAARIR
jgi:hypothetical protein